jgi:hypothetical protein
MQEGIPISVAIIVVAAILGGLLVMGMVLFALLQLAAAYV